eukprot:TRINITY_DN3436_c0_g3_i2.p1 TRINITY_DN3436_c0_g3~~TRINITY_DN3436_c0_g3_i2.p1  ORF type:complete len:1137 (-),score=253.62 TRINITY_DN3436_c0_g3_i2:2148-5558(-)
MLFEWRHLTLSVKENKETKTILHDLSGHAKSGQILGIMGSSGAGKTSLLLALAQRSAGHVSGHVLLDGEPVRFNETRIAFVTQEDNYFPALTVQETILLRASLKAPSGTPLDERLRKTSDCLKILGLEHCAHTQVGNDEIRGVSGGERRRVAIAEAMVSDPDLIFMDEPTSGLDAATALSVMKSLRDLANAGKTIICTIHQPRADVFNSLDCVMLLAKGRVAYFGHSSNVVSYFASLNPPLHCPTTCNPADFGVDLTTIVGRSEQVAAQKRVEFLVQAYQSQQPTDEFTPSDAPVAASTATEPRDRLVYTQASWPLQFALLTQRAWRNLIRVPRNLVARLLQSTVIAVVIGLVFLRLPYGQTSIQDRPGLLFFAMLFYSYATMLEVILKFPPEKGILRRERASDAYATSAYFCGKFAAEMPFELFFTCVFLVILYWMTGLNPAADRFFIFTGVSLLLSLSTSTLGVVACAGMATVQNAMYLAPTVLLLGTLFAGFFVNIQTIPVYLSWLQYVSYFKWAYEALVVNEFRGVTFVCESAELVNGTCPIPTGDVALTILGFQNVNIGMNVGILAAFITVLYILGFLILRSSSAPVRSTIHAKPVTDAATPPSLGDDNTGGPDRDGQEGTELQEIALPDTNRAVMSINKIAPVELSWQNVSYKVNGGKKTIVSDCSGVVRPGTMLAIIGASGAGKTSLLNVLASRAEGDVRGVVRMNGRPAHEQRHAFGYLTQEDQLMTFLTVRETLMATAEFVMPATSTHEQREQRVQEVIGELGLGACANTRVGNEHYRGLSGGEKRRLSVAECLITNPSLIFLDEPTSGLDAATALSVVSSLRDLASAGRTIVCTIHQPRDTIFEQFDQLMIMARGRSVYMGDAAKALHYFASLSPLAFHCPPYTNPADFLLDLTVMSVPQPEDEQLKAGYEDRVAYLLSHFDEDSCTLQSVTSLTSGGVDKPPPAPVFARSWLWQFRVHVIRSWKNVSRNPYPSLVRMVSNAITCIFFGLYFLRRDWGQTSFQDRRSLLFSFILTVSWDCMDAVLDAFSREKPIVTRERARHEYHLSAYVVARMCTDMVFDMVVALVYAVISYWMANLNVRIQYFINNNNNSICVSMETALTVVRCVFFLCVFSLQQIASSSCWRF